MSWAMTFTKVSDYQWVCAGYLIKKHHCGGGEKYSAWLGNQSLGYFDSLEDAGKACGKKGNFGIEFA